MLNDTKRAYLRPELRVFGSVRNLTGGSIGFCNDTNMATAVMVFTGSNGQGNYCAN